MSEQDQKRNNTPLPKPNRVLVIANHNDSILMQALLNYVSKKPELRRMDTPFCTQCGGNENSGHDASCIITAMWNIVDDLDMNRQAEIHFPKGKKND